MRNKKVVLLIVMVLIGIGFVFASVTPLLSNFAIDPNPMEKSTKVSMTFSQNTRVIVTVETVFGEVIKTIYSGSLEAGSYEFFWNRLSNNEEFVPDGTYYLNVNYEQKYTSTKKTLILK